LFHHLLQEVLFHHLPLVALFHHLLQAALFHHLPLAALFLLLLLQVLYLQRVLSLPLVQILPPFHLFLLINKSLILQEKVIPFKYSELAILMELRPVVVHNRKANKDYLSLKDMYAEK